MERSTFEVTAKIIFLYALIFAGLNFLMIIVGRAAYKDINADQKSKGDISHDRH